MPEAPRPPLPTLPAADYYHVDGSGPYRVTQLRHARRLRRTGGDWRVDVEYVEASQGAASPPAWPPRIFCREISDFCARFRIGSPIGPRPEPGEAAAAIPAEPVGKGCRILLIRAPGVLDAAAQVHRALAEAGANVVGRSLDYYQRREDAHHAGRFAVYLYDGASPVGCLSGVDLTVNLINYEDDVAPEGIGARVAADVLRAARGAAATPAVEPVEVEAHPAKPWRVLLIAAPGAAAMRTRVVEELAAQGLDEDQPVKVYCAQWDGDPDHGIRVADPSERLPPLASLDFVALLAGPGDGRMSRPPIPAVDAVFSLRRVGSTAAAEQRDADLAAAILTYLRIEKGEEGESDAGEAASAPAVERLRADYDSALADLRDGHVALDKAGAGMGLGPIARRVEALVEERDRCLAAYNRADDACKRAASARDRFAADLEARDAILVKVCEERDARASEITRAHAALDAVGAPGNPDPEDGSDAGEGWPLDGRIRGLLQGGCRASCAVANKAAHALLDSAGLPVGDLSERVEGLIARAQRLEEGIRVATSVRDTLEHASNACDPAEHDRLLSDLAAVAVELEAGEVLGTSPAQRVRMLREQRDVEARSARALRLEVRGLQAALATEKAEAGKAAMLHIDSDTAIRETLKLHGVFFDWLPDGVRALSRLRDEACEERDGVTRALNVAQRMLDAVNAALDAARVPASGGFEDAGTHLAQRIAHLARDRDREAAQHGAAHCRALAAVEDAAGLRREVSLLTAQLADKVAAHAACIEVLDGLRMALNTSAPYDTLPGMVRAMAGALHSEAAEAADARELRREVEVAHRYLKLAGAPEHAGGLAGKAAWLAGCLEAANTALDGIGGVAGGIAAGARLEERIAALAAMWARAVEERQEHARALGEAARERDDARAALETCRADTLTPRIVERLIAAGAPAGAGVLMQLEHVCGALARARVAPAPLPSVFDPCGPAEAAEWAARDAAEDRLIEDAQQALRTFGVSALAVAVERLRMERDHLRERDAAEGRRLALAYAVRLDPEKLAAAFCNQGGEPTWADMDADIQADWIAWTRATLAALLRDPEAFTRARAKRILAPLPAHLAHLDNPEGRAALARGVRAAADLAAADLGRFLADGGEEEAHAPLPVDTRPRAAYDAYAAGATWKEAARVAGYASEAAAFQTVKEAARRHGWAWPVGGKVRRTGNRVEAPLPAAPAPAPVEAAPAPAAPTVPPHAEAAYLAFSWGEGWARIGSAIGVTSIEVEGAAEAYARVKKLPYPPRKAAALPPREHRAYDLRLAGMAWEGIGRLLRFADAATAKSKCRAFAAAQGLEWPPPMAGGGAATVTLPALPIDPTAEAVVDAMVAEHLGSRGFAKLAPAKGAAPAGRAYRKGAPAEAYQLRLQGEEWTDIAAALGYPHREAARSAVKHYCTRTNVAFPREAGRPTGQQGARRGGRS